MNSNDIRRYNLNLNHNHNYSSSTSSNVNSNYPSFSASLLEEIYRSIDDDKPRDSHSRRTNRVDRYVLEQWMEMEMEKEKLKLKEEKEKEKEKIVKYRRYSMPENGEFRRPLYYSSSTSSSDSSSGIGGFSSSDTDSMYGAPAKAASTLRPIRTADFGRKCYSDDNSKKSKSKKDGKLQHALKLYADLKKVKQPISPGGKIASFLNSLFNSGNSKTPKKSKSTPSTAAVTSASVPSTATSYSRSCLSKTPSSAGRYERRSVRFCPVSVVVDETGKTSVRNGVVSSSRMEVCGDNDELLKVEIREKQRRVEEAAKELLNNYRSNNNNLIRKEFKVNVISADNNTNTNTTNNNKNIDNDRDFEDENDDGESCCSSDLFELDNLLEIGVDDRYRQELPVYETTYVGTNRALAISVARS